MSSDLNKLGQSVLSLVEQLRSEYDQSHLRFGSNIGDLYKLLKHRQLYYTDLVNAIETVLGSSIHLTGSTLVVPFLTAMANDAATKAVLGEKE